MVQRSPISAPTRRRVIKAALAPLTLAMLPSLAVKAVAADEYPARPIRMVVPFAAGGGTDLLARLLGHDMSDALGKPVVIDNHPGGGTQIGAEQVAKAAPDGYTLLSASVTTYAFNPGLYPKLGYDPVKDFAPISLTGRFALVLISNPGFPAASVAELIKMAKDRPNTINFASSGIGSPHQLAMELLAARAEVKMTHVPYRGAAPALQDLIAGHVPVMITDYASAKQAIESNAVKLLAVCSPTRMADLSQTPTVAEGGYPGYEASAWQGIVAPAGTPAPIVGKLNASIVGALRSPALQQKLAALGVESISSTPAEFSDYMKAEIEKWRQVIKSANITL